MRSEVVIVACRGLSPRIECVGGLAARRTGPDTVHLVSAAATPLGGDAITVRITVEPGARLRVRSVAATLALPGADTAESRAAWQLEVAGDLDLDPQPTVVAGGSRHLTSTRVAVAGEGRVRVRERVQIGRTGEREGFWSGSLHADIDGQPLLRHRVELGPGSIADDALGTPMACVSELRYPDPITDAGFNAGVDSAFDAGLDSAFDAVEGTVLPLAAGGYLATWQGQRL